MENTQGNALLSDNVEPSQGENQDPSDRTFEPGAGSEHGIYQRQNVSTSRHDEMLSPSIESTVSKDGVAIKEAQIKLKLAHLNTVIKQAELERKKAKLELAALRQAQL